MLSDDLEEWAGSEGGRGGRGYDIYVVMTDSHYCTAETNTTL